MRYLNIAEAGIVPKHLAVYQPDKVLFHLLGEGSLLA
jgi:hypothetical protein